MLTAIGYFTGSLGENNPSNLHKVSFISLSLGFHPTVYLNANVCVNANNPH